MRRQSLIAALTALLAAPAVATTPAPGKWRVEADSSPLTNLPFVSAALLSERPLSNMIGAPESAQLILRCRDRVMAAYVTWPEVVSHDMDNLAGEPKTLAYWKTDDGPIASGLWAISTDGTAAGAFSNGAATKLIGAWRGARRFVVRLTGRTTQDAVFDLAGVDEIAGKVLAACGASASASAETTMMPAAPAVPFSSGISVTISGQAPAALSGARQLLEGRGFKIASYDEGAGSLVTEPLKMPLTTKQANCGSALGIPYLADRRARPLVAYRLVAVGQQLTISTAIGGIYKGAVGGRDSALRCTSKGVLEAAFAEQLRATFGQ